MWDFIKRRRWLILIIIAAILTNGFFLFEAWQGSLTDFQELLFQYIVLLTGITITFGFAFAYRIEKGHGKSAFRRLQSLFESVMDAGVILDGDLSDEVKLAKIDSANREQLRLVNDSIEDWREIMPEEVAKEEKRTEVKKQKELDNAKS